MARGKAFKDAEEHAVRYFQNTPKTESIYGLIREELLREESVNVLYNENMGIDIPRRRRGQSTAKPLDDYESFYFRYANPESKKDLSRDKLIHMAVVLNLNDKVLDDLLGKLGKRPLSASNPFELCVWFLLHTGYEEPEKHSLAVLNSLYQEVLQIMDQHRDRSGVDPGSGHYSQSAVLTEQLKKKRNDFMTSSKQEFLALIQEVAPFLRYHSQTSETAFREIIGKIEKHLTKLSEIAKKLGGSITFKTKELFFERFGPYYKGEEGSLDTVWPQLAESKGHYRQPSRELLILLLLFKELMTRTVVHLTVSEVNSELLTWGLPPLTAQLAFDRLIMELLSYRKVSAKDFWTLLEIYNNARVEAGHSAPLLDFQLTEQVSYSLLRLVLDQADSTGNVTAECAGETRPFVQGVCTFLNLPLNNYKIAIRWHDAYGEITAEQWIEETLKTTQPTLTVTISP